jgi:hypothetical protein
MPEIIELINTFLAAARNADVSGLAPDLSADLYSALVALERIATTDEPIQAVFDRALAALPEKCDLVYINYDDKLTDEQLRSLLAGNPLYEDNFFSQWESDCRYQSAVEIIEENVLSEDVLRLEGADMVDELRFALEERDESDPLRDLLGNTPQKWFRYYLDVDLPASLFEDETDINGYVDDVFNAVPIERTPVLETRIREMIENASYGGGLYLYWHGDAEPLVSAAQRWNGWSDHQDPTPLTLTVVNADLLVLDRLNGSGADCDLPLGTTITVAYDPENLHLDSGNGSWSDWICGGLSATVNADVTIAPSNDSGPLNRR